MLKNNDNFRNMKFGLWTVLDKEPKYLGKWKSKCWLCKCDCGKENYVIAKNLKKGTSTKCLKCRGKKTNNLDFFIGKKFGSWNVLSFDKIDNRNNKGILYVNCQCDCGYNKSIVASTLKHNRYPRCVKCLPKIKGNRVLRTFWNKVIWAANKRNLEFNISFEYAIQLLELQNYTCKLSGIIICFAKDYVSHSHGETTASLDRIDSSKGYIEGNVQWVHKDINRMKQEFSQEKFLEYCDAIIRYMR